MNEPMTYDDFISQVEEAMLPDSPFRVTSAGNQSSFTEFETANSNFKFKDIEVGKIYVFWVSINPKTNHLWFLTPHTLHNEHDYSVYWCYYSTPKGRMNEHSGSRNWVLSGYKCSSWSDYIWGGGRRWKVLGNNISNVFINWNENPFEIK